MMKPCPFCGGLAEAHVGLHAFDDVFIRCSRCNADGPLFDASELSGVLAVAENTQSAVEHWNGRFIGAMEVAALLEYQREFRALSEARRKRALLG